MLDRLGLDPRTQQQIMVVVEWFQRRTAGINWYRIAFIFLPAMIRGDLASFTLYLPFIFGYILKRIVQQMNKIFEMKDNIKVQLKIPRADYLDWVKWSILEMGIVLAFLVFCHYIKAETRMLGNFFISSFLVPMIRNLFPQRTKGPLQKGRPMWDTTWGEVLVNVFIILGLVVSWVVQGMDQLFLGFLFLLAIPTVQDRFWLKTTQHGYLVLGILLACLPFFSLGICSRFFPSYTVYFPKPYLQVLCFLSNATPQVPDITKYYEILGVSPDSDTKTIKRVFRDLSLKYHPDKVGDDPVLLGKFHKIKEASDALTKNRAEFDKAVEDQELNEMAPRCEAFLVMMYFWLLHSLIDWVQIEDNMQATQTALKTYIANGRKLDYHAIGMTSNSQKLFLKELAENKNVELPYIQARIFATGNRDDINNFRKLLQDYKAPLDKYPEVKGTIKSAIQQFVLTPGKEKLEEGDNHYKGWTVSVDGIDVVTDEFKAATTEVVKYEKLGKHYYLTVSPDLGFEPEMGTSKVTLIPPKGSSGKKVEVKLGFNVYHQRHQIFELGAEDKDEAYNWRLINHDEDYSTYNFEVYEGDTYLGHQRIESYNAKERTVYLKGPLIMSGAGEPSGGKSKYLIYPDQLLPHAQQPIFPCMLRQKTEMGG